MKLCFIADCYIHYGKLGKETIGICAKKTFKCSSY